MAVKYLADRVHETSTTTGTGTYSLTGPIVGHQSFVAGVGTGVPVYYVAYNVDDWEVGIGTVTDSNPDTLSRTTILSSSNADAAVNWVPGIKDIVLSVPASDHAGQSKLYIRNVSNAQGVGSQTAVTAGVDTTLELNGDGSNNFSTDNVGTGKLELDAAFNGGTGGVIIDNLDPQTILSLRLTLVNKGTPTNGIAKVFLVPDKALPGTGFTILSAPRDYRTDVEVPVLFEAFHGGIQAVYVKMNADNARTFEVRGLQVVAHENNTRVV